MDVSTAEYESIRLEPNQGGERVCLLSIQERLGIRRVQEPICVGIPFPQALVSDLLRLALFNASGEPIPFQIQVLSAWVDGSAKWILVEFLANVEPFQCQEYQVKILEQAVPSVLASSLAVRESNDEIQIETGNANFRFCRNGWNPLFYVGLQGQSSQKFSIAPSHLTPSPVTDRVGVALLPSPTICPLIFT